MGSLVRSARISSRTIVSFGSSKKSITAWKLLFNASAPILSWGRGRCRASFEADSLSEKGGAFIRIPVTGSVGRYGLSALGFVFHLKTDFDRYLPVLDLSLVYRAARFDHLKSAQILYGFVGLFNGFSNSIFNGSRGSAGEFDEFVDMVFHFSLISDQRGPLYGV